MAVRSSNSYLDWMPRYSPDGTKIVFSSKRDGDDNEKIYIMDANGSNPTRLTSGSGQDWYPCFSPDGRKIVFSSNRSGNWEIYVMSVDGSNLTKITDHTSGNSYPFWGQ